jgi:hypothetical protein
MEKLKVIFVQVSYLEVYNEQVIDLLVPERTPLKVNIQRVFNYL